MRASWSFDNDDHDLRPAKGLAQRAVNPLWRTRNYDRSLTDAPPAAESALATAEGLRIIREVGQVANPARGSRASASPRRFIGGTVREIIRFHRASRGRCRLLEVRQ